MLSPLLAGTPEAANRGRRVHTAGREWVVFGPPPADHVSPDLLDDAALQDSVQILRAKLHSAHAELVTAHLRGAAVSVAALAGALVLLWLGPASFVETLGGRGLATAWDVVLWWLVLAPAAALAGGYGAFLLGRTLRDVRGWRHRSDELGRKLNAACREQHRRAEPSSSPLP